LCFVSSFRFEYRNSEELRLPVGSAANLTASTAIQLLPNLSKNLFYFYYPPQRLILSGLPPEPFALGVQRYNLHLQTAKSFFKDFFRSTTRIANRR